MSAYLGSHHYFFGPSSGKHRDGGLHTQGMSSSSRKRYRNHQLALLSGSVVLIIFVVLVIAIGIRFTIANTNANADGPQYSPTDTRMVPFSNAFCQSLTLSSSKKDNNPYNVCLYRLSSAPKLTGHERFSFSGKLDFSYLNYNSYLFYMHEGSRFDVSACSTVAGKTITFYLIKGQREFKQWTYYPTASYAMGSYKVVDICSSGKNATHSYTITSPGYYYMVFLTRRMFSGDFNTHFTFSRTFYEFSNESILESCAMDVEDSKSCSIGIPLSGSGALLLSVQPLPGNEDDIDWMDHIGLRTKCNPRVWVYVMVALASLISCIVIPVVVVVCVCSCMRKRKRSRKYTSLSSDPTCVSSYPPRVDGSKDRALPSITPDYTSSTTYGIN